MIELIVARARNGVIGADNRMLWRIPEDLAFFKRTTMGSPIVMGRKTRLSIGRPLPGRRNVAVTRNPDFRAEGTETVTSLEAAFELLADAPRIFVIGGGEIYREALPSADRCWVTVLDRDFEGDTVFPELPENEWTYEVVDRLEPVPDRPYAVEFRRYDRRKMSTEV